jgi:phospholipid/cholesterol/gamma-HCH transport system substrate-binding protein
MTGNVIETVMGAVVLVVAAVFLFFAYTTSQVRAVQGYQVTAQFERVGSLRDGADVRIAGVKVGSVVSETLDPKTFLAAVRVSIDPAYKLPDDTVAEIVSNGRFCCAI